MLTPTTLDKTLNGYTSETIITSATNNILHWWLQPSMTNTLSSSNVIIRGGDTIDKSTTTTISTNSNYRILLERYN